MSKKEKNTSALNEKQGVEQPATLSKTAAEKLKNQRKKKQSVDELVNGIINGDKTALSRAITMIESTAQKHQQQAKALIKHCLPYANNAVRIGITGVPGVGKSTFIEQFGISLTQSGKKVAVLAVDPSSSVSKGSILGDKTRMESLVKDANAFIRPSSSGDSLGGVARKTREAIILCEAAGYTHIIIETVGVGQSETVVHSMTDFFLLLKLAGAGDELQGIKRGIIEMADAIVINKADGENVKAAKLAKTEFNRALHLYPPKTNGWTAKTLTCSALNNNGITEVSRMISDFISEMKKAGHFQKKRIEQHKFWLLQTVESRLKSDFYNNTTIKKELKFQLEKIEANETTPFEAADVLLEML
ncbi:ATPase/protein kinase [Patiriisocius marinistellae]|uniref:ATPase/protein kinase n=1 Tax=Patiriisocius marinistellae TaxID=2494560 RepID=A0A5J4G2C3_9FLAO|nr:methylmalonyl Co-A mutase-associated GTPase MeaB [Patiriisocius marinistellae]GEQ86836.1 ATPase/protein kinase [Patiriisocius marinistellae]